MIKRKLIVIPNLKTFHFLLTAHSAKIADTGLKTKLAMY